jgi:glycopeptide antibiotics resistance protein
MTNKLTSALFIIYLFALFWIILFKFNIQFSYMGNIRSVNLIPFNEPLVLNGKISLAEMVLNIIIFMPLGIYAGILFEKWTIKKQLVFVFLISLIIEVLQFILILGAFDVTDIINNTLGGTIGLVIFRGIEKAFKNRAKAQRFINIIATIGTVLMISLLLFLKINKLFMFRM